MDKVMDLSVLADKNLLDPEILDDELIELLDEAVSGLSRLATRQNVEFPKELEKRVADIFDVYEKSH